MNLLCCGSGKPKSKKSKCSHEASSNLRARAVKDYNNLQDASHLSFREGELITVTEQNPSNGLWKGFRCGAYSGVMTRPGYFPANAVVLIDPHLSDQTSSRKISGAPSELSKQYRRHHLGNGSRHGNHQSSDVHQGAPPSPITKAKSGLHTDEDGLPTYNSYCNQPQNQLSVRLPAGDVHVAGKESPGGGSQGSGASAYQLSCQACNGAVASQQQQQQHRLSGQSCESGVSSSSSRQSYHSGSGGANVVGGSGSGGGGQTSNGSSSSQGSLDRLEESGYSSTVNVHELLQQGVTDSEILQAWLTGLHLEEYYRLFVEAGYDMPTISRMMPEDLTAIGITKPSVRKKLKSEIGRLTIHDGIPDYKPSTVGEWLGLLHLSEYADTLQRQGYADINTITDITWEDLEDVGVKKLGHQKKMILAIDRLRRLNGSGRRLSGVGGRPPPASSTDVVDSPSLAARHAVRPPPSSTSSTPVNEVGAPVAVHHNHPRSALVVAAAAASQSSGIYSVSSGGVVVLPTNVAAGRQPQQQQPPHATLNHTVSLPPTSQQQHHHHQHNPVVVDAAKPSATCRGDVRSVDDEDRSTISGALSVTPTVNHAGQQQQRQRNTFSAAAAASSGRQGSTVQSASAHRVAGVGRGGDSSDGDLTPTNERRSTPTAAAASSSSNASSTSASTASSVRETVQAPPVVISGTALTRPSAHVVPLSKPTAQMPARAAQPTSSVAAFSPSSKSSPTTGAPCTSSSAEVSFGSDWSASDIAHTSTPKIDPTLRQTDEQDDHGGSGGLSVSSDERQQQQAGRTTTSSSASPCFSYGTLPRKFSQRNNRTTAAAAADCTTTPTASRQQDIAAALDELLSFGLSSADSPATDVDNRYQRQRTGTFPSTSFAAVATSGSGGVEPPVAAVVGRTAADNNNVAGRREPPVPPVRTASFRSDIRAAMLASESNARQNGTGVDDSVVVNGFAVSGAKPPVNVESARRHQHHQQQQQQRAAEDKFSSASSNSDEFFVAVNAGVSSDNLLSEVIERLERGTGSRNTTARRTGSASGGGSSSGQRLGDWQDSSRSSSGSEDSDSGLDSRRSESTSSLVEACAAAASSSSAGGGGCSAADTNTLPFANENVGTIKQRGQSSSSSSAAAAKQSASSPPPVSAADTSPSVGGGVDTVVQLNSSSAAGDWSCSVDDEMQPGGLQSSASMLSMESDAVFNDIDGMLMGLTAELDQMLKLQG